MNRLGEPALVIEIPPPNQKLPLMEYLFLLPAILACGALFSAMRYAQAGMEPIYAFRLFFFSHLLIMTSIILFFSRPSVRQRHPWLVNLLRSSLFAMIALAPVVLAGVALANTTGVQRQIFSPVEMGFAWVGLLLAIVTNVTVMIMVVRADRENRFSRWVLPSVAAHIFWAVVLFKLW